MSRPGELTAAELTTIAGGAPLPHVAAARFTAADHELASEFGFRMRVKPDYGGYRTRAKQRQINPSVPPDSSEHCVIYSPRGRVAAADIDNQRAFRLADNDAFVAILLEHGITFHVLDEKWHSTITMAAFAGIGNQPLDPQKEDDMENRTPVYWAASGTNTPDVKVNSMWMQKDYGGPLFKITDDYRSEPNEYAWIAAAFGVAGRAQTTTTVIQKLITRRGITTSLDT